MGTLVFQANLGGAVNLIGPNTASTVNFTLPSADGTSGQALVTNGSGTLSFSTFTSGAAGSNTQVQFNSSGAFAGSSNLTFNGTTLTAANTSVTTSETLSYGTANGVAYLNGSKVVTTGSALTFDGTNFAATGNIAAGTTSAGANLVAYASTYTANGLVRLFGTDGVNKVEFGAASATTAFLFTRPGVSMLFGVNDTEQMRLTSTGLGIGTSSPTRQLQVANGTNAIISALNGSIEGVLNATTTNVNVGAASNHFLTLSTNGTERVRVDTSGNLGLGVTPISGARMSIGGSSNFPVLKISRTDASFDTGVLALGDGNSSAINVGIWRGAANSVSSTGNWLNLGGYSGITFNSGNAAIGSQTQAMTLDASGNLFLGRTTGGNGVLRTLSQHFDDQDLRGNVTIADSAAYNANPEAGVAFITNYTASADANMGSISVGKANTTSGNLDAYMRFVVRSNSAGNIERARIDSSGNLLVGATSTYNSNKFYVNTNSAANAAFFSNNVDATFQLSLSSGITKLDAPTGILTLATSGTERARIDSSGQMAIGANTISTVRLYVKGSGATSGTFSLYADDSNASNLFYVRNDGAGYLKAASWTYGSDASLKENIKYLTPQECLGKLLQAKPATFDYINGQKENYGYVANDVEEWLPEAVPMLESGTRGLKDGFINVLSTGAIQALNQLIQEQQAIIEQLKADVAALKGN